MLVLPGGGAGGGPGWWCFAARLTRVLQLALVGCVNVVELEAWLGGGSRFVPPAKRIHWIGHAARRSE